MTQVLPPKKEVALALLERSNVDVYLDPRANGVVVPPQFRKEPRLILKIGLNMPVPIPDLRLDDDSMSCTLSFNRAKFFCVVPWMSVFAMVGDDGRGMVWPDDVPQELAIRGDEKKPNSSEALVPSSPAPSSRTPKGKSRIASAGPESERSTKAKRPRPGKKKEDEAPSTRAVLHAVPAPAPSSTSVSRNGGVEKLEKLEERREAVEKPAPPRVVDRPPTSRPKRELPPYLRVVK